MSKSNQVSVFNSHYNRIKNLTEENNFLFSKLSESDRKEYLEKYHKFQLKPVIQKTSTTLPRRPNNTSKTLPRRPISTANPEKINGTTNISNNNSTTTNIHRKSHSKTNDRPNKNIKSFKNHDKIYKKKICITNIGGWTLQPKNYVRKTSSKSNNQRRTSANPRLRNKAKARSGNHNNNKTLSSRYCNVCVRYGHSTKNHNKIYTELRKTWKPKLPGGGGEDEIHKIVNNPEPLKIHVIDPQTIFDLVMDNDTDEDYEKAMALHLESLHAKPINKCEICNGTHTKEQHSKIKEDHNLGARKTKTKSQKHEKLIEESNNRQEQTPISVNKIGTDVGVETFFSDNGRFEEILEAMDKEEEIQMENERIRMVVNSHFEDSKSLLRTFIVKKKMQVKILPEWYQDLKHMNMTMYSAKNFYEYYSLKQKWTYAKSLLLYKLIGAIAKSSGFLEATITLTFTEEGDVLVPDEDLRNDLKQRVIMKHSDGKHALIKVKADPTLIVENVIVPQEMYEYSYEGDDTSIEGLMQWYNGKYPTKDRYLTISWELLAQTMHINVISPSSTEKDLWNKICYAVGYNNTVNVSRYDFGMTEIDTAIFAFYLSLYKKQSLKLPFPKGLPEKSEDNSDIDFVKLLSINLSALRKALTSVFGLK